MGTADAGVDAYDAIPWPPLAPADGEYIGFAGTPLGDGRLLPDDGTGGTKLRVLGSAALAGLMLWPLGWYAELVA